MLGQRLTAALEARGDQVVRLVRGRATKRGDRPWDPTSGDIAGPKLSDVDAVVNLAGASIAGWRWTTKYKDLLLTSRVDTTRTIADTLAGAGLHSRCHIFLSASAIGFYGHDLGDRIVTEQSGRGTGFLADLCEQWEEAAQTAVDSGVRVAYLRTANVLAPEGGIIPLLRIPFRLGLGGRTGSGKQWFSWITADDHVRAMLWLLDGAVSGPVNLSAPDPVRNEVFARAFAKELRRPSVVPFPKRMASLALTQTMVEETIGAGQRVVPARLSDGGFVFKHPTLTDALHSVVSA